DVRLAARLRLVAAPTDGEEEYRLGTGVEMLMEPHFRRHEHASRTPIDALLGFALLPHERVAVSSDDQDMNAGTVTMRFLVRADTPERDVRFDRVVDHAKDRALGPAAAVEAAGIGLAHADVGDEVGRPLLRRRLLFEVALFGVVAVAKHERVFENKLVIVERIDHPRCAGHGDVARGFLTGGVVVFMPGIHRDREITAFLPFESLLAARINPYRGSPLTLEYIHGLFEQMPVRFERLPGRDLGDVRIIESSLAFQIQKCRQSLAARFPRTQLEIIKILDEQAAISWQSLRLLPLLVRRLISDTLLDFLLSGYRCISHDYLLRFV